MDKKIIFYRTHENCPYLPKRVSRLEFFETKTFPETCYEDLLANGFRRSGKIFYRYVCPECGECHEMRVLVSQFMLSRSQERAARKNRDVSMTVFPAEFRPDVYALYRRYCVFRHGKTEGERTFRDFLCSAPLDSRMALYHAQDKLVAVGWLDILPNGLSSVYFAFEPEESRRSLGVFSIVKEIELCKTMGLNYYYLGFIVKDSPKMSYKAAFLPHQRLQNGRWVTYTEKETRVSRAENADNAKSASGKQAG